MDINEAKTKLGSVLVYWDSLQKEYKEGKLCEVHADTKYARISTKSGRMIDVPLKCVHAGTLDEIVNLENATDDVEDIDEDELEKMARALRLDYNNFRD